MSACIFWACFIIWFMFGFTVIVLSSSLVGLVVRMLGDLLCTELGDEQRLDVVVSSASACRDSRCVLTLIGRCRLRRWRLRLDRLFELGKHLDLIELIGRADRTAAELVAEGRSRAEDGGKRLI